MLGAYVHVVDDAATSDSFLYKPYPICLDVRKHTRWEERKNRKKEAQNITKFYFMQSNFINDDDDDISILVILKENKMKCKNRILNLASSNLSGQVIGIVSL